MSLLLFRAELLEFLAGAGVKEHFSWEVLSRYIFSKSLGLETSFGERTL